jgi:hypothetical protein
VKSSLKINPSPTYGWESSSRMIIHDNNIGAAMALVDPNNVEAYRTTILNGHDAEVKEEVRVEIM